MVVTVMVVSDEYIGSQPPPPPLPPPHTHTHTSRSLSLPPPFSLCKNNVHRKTVDARKSVDLFRNCDFTKEKEETTNQYAEQKRWVISFDLRESREIPVRERKRVPDDRSYVSKGSPPPGPTFPASEHGRFEHPRLSEERYGRAVPKTMLKQVRAILIESSC